MKQISSRFSIAVHILSLVAVTPDPCTGDYLAGSVNTNPVIIRRITGMLKKAGLIDVRPGVGGATLRVSPDDITLLMVFKAVQAASEGELFHFHDNPNPDCPIGGNIEALLRAEMRAAQEAFEARLASVTLRKLLEGFKPHLGAELRVP
ncbi:Rrf2 family transcriptional regulator [Gorillibacterium timonense]|uniref:Rrf2 family transcriptional regulator n=1 Tax=Gorillibacterium timonense TaxID=1689269 RepID=UPI00071D20F7|nr:Rrf2 family transcriptional regulator [Gorillibacterium timonense]